MTSPIKRLLLHLALAGTLLSTPIFASARDITTDVAPPAPRSESVPRPRAGSVWAAGHWEWSGRFYTWVAGTWITERAGMHWIADQWEQSGDHWHYLAGHWEK